MSQSNKQNMSIDKSWPGYNKGIEPDDGFEWIWQEAIPADLPGRDPFVVYIPFGYEKRVLPKGWKKTPENKALELDIIFEKDVEFVMRDGVKVCVVALIPTCVPVWHTPLRPVNPFDSNPLIVSSLQLYADIYRPADTAGQKIPIIMPYSPYGKGGGGANLMDVVPYRVGVPKSRQSGLEKFEGYGHLGNSVYWILSINSLLSADCRPQARSE